MAEVRGLDGDIHPYLSTNAEENTASIAAQSFWDRHGDGGGIELKVHKGVPLQSGMGSSAASAVAAVVAANGLLDNPQPVEEYKAGNPALPLAYAIHSSPRSRVWVNSLNTLKRTPSKGLKPFSPDTS